MRAKLIFKGENADLERQKAHTTCLRNGRGAAGSAGDVRI